MSGDLYASLSREARHGKRTDIRIAEDHRHDALVGLLEVAVPMWILNLQGHSPEQRIAIARRCADEVGSHGDTLMFGGKKGEAARIFNTLAEGLAVAAYQPGGVTFAGRHWCTDHRACERAAAGLPDEPAEPASAAPNDSRATETVRIAPQWAAALGAPLVAAVSPGPMTALRTGGPDGCAA